MDDRFKFKAWDGVEMWEVKSFDRPYRPEGYYEKQRKIKGEYKEWNSVTVWFFNLDPDSTQVIKLIELDKVILIQCTAIKDIDDDLIFDGDVVNGSGPGVLSEDVGNYYIKFQDGAYRLIDCEDGRRIFCFLDRDEVSALNLKIISNIYKNPELLKGNHGKNIKRI